MAGPPRNPEPGEDPGVGTDRGSPPRMPRWVKWPAIIIGVLILVLIVLRLTGFEHGPGRHTPGGDAPPASVAPGGGHAPAGGHG